MITEVYELGAIDIRPIGSKVASGAVVRNHYLHRRPSQSFSYGLFISGHLIGAVTYGVPASRHLQKSACPSNPDLVIELNRLWVDDFMPKNIESWFVSRTMKMLPARVVVSYADPVYGHQGLIYRALNFNYAGWTDMERKTPRIDYIPANPNTHTRDAFRNGYVEKRYRISKVKYWKLTGNKTERKALAKLCPWPSYDWNQLPPPLNASKHVQVSA